MPHRHLANAVKYILDEKNNRGRKERILDKNTAMYKFLRQKLIDECVSPQTALDELKKSGIKTDEQYPSKATLYRMMRRGDFE